jgi:hypothetical protein
VSIQNSTVLGANLPATITCPAGHYQGTIATNGTCRTFSYPFLANNIFWQNSAYYIGVGALSAQYQQNVVSLYNAFTTTLAPTQPQTDATTANGAGVTITGGTGACVAANYWEIGVRGDTGPTNHGSGVTLTPTNSVLTDANDYPGLGNLASNPNFISQYCDGSRTPPEFAASGWAVPPGIADATVPNPIFNLTPVATVDEGNNWINMRWGPLSMQNPVTNTFLGNYALAAGSPLIDVVPRGSAGFAAAPSTDYFGNPRPDPSNHNAVDVGAVEFQGLPSTTEGAILYVEPTSLAFGNERVNTTSSPQTLTVYNNGGAATTTGITVGAFPAGYSRAGGTCTTGGTLAIGGSCTITVIFHPTTSGPSNGAVAITSSVPVSGSPVALSGTGVRLTATPANLVFVTNGGGFSGSQTVTVSNPVGSGGTTGPITYAISPPTNGVVFRVVTTTSTCVTGVAATTGLAPGTSCTLNVQFQSPTILTLGQATLSISDTEPATVTVGLSGFRFF